MLRKLIPGLLLILAGCLVWYALMTYLGGKSFTRSHWPTTQGTIFATRIRQGTSSDNLYMTVQFRYQVNGAGHFHEQTWAAPPDTSELESQYAVGAVVPVYYNPMNPDEAVIDPRVDDYGWRAYLFDVAIILGLGLPILGIVQIHRAVRRPSSLSARRPARPVAP